MLWTKSSEIVLYSKKRRGLRIKPGGIPPLVAHFDILHPELHVGTY